jgi:hypothetical protein
MSVTIYKSNTEIVNDLVRQPTITIDGSNYKELINVVYEISYRPVKVDLPPQEPDDDVERNYLLSRLDQCMEIILIEDANTRRAVYPNIYPNGLCKCICLVHFFVRGKELHINEYYRSQNYDRNYMYDCDTACLLMERGLSLLNKYCAFEVDKIKPGKITVFCSNLHIKLK